MKQESMMCILKEELNMGTRVFYIKYNEQTHNQYNHEYVWVYTDNKLTNKVLACNVSKIILINDSDSDKLNYEFGSLYPEISYFNSIKSEWETK